MNLTAYYNEKAKDLSSDGTSIQTVTVYVKKAEMILADYSAFLKFKYNSVLVDEIKKLSKHYWNSETQLWEINENDLSYLQIFCPQFNYEIIKVHYDRKIPESFQFKVPPLPHQLEAIEYGLNHPSFLNGDQPGLGKTYESLMVSEIRREEEGLKHCLVICGVNSLQKNWKKEIEQYTTQKAHILGERYTKKGTLKAPSVVDKMEDINNLDELPYYVIINIESMRNDQISTALSDLCVKEIGFIIFDECHKCKSSRSAQGEGTLKLNSKYKIALSGTPITSSPLDLYFFMRWTGIEQRNYWSFSRHYQIFKEINKKKEDGTIQKINIPVGYQHLDEIQNKINNFMIRRLKKDVLDLPEKMYKYEYLEMGSEQRKLYEEIYSKTLAEADKIKEMSNPLVAFLRMRQCTADPSIVSSSVKDSIKLDRMVDIVEECIENDEKIIIFSSFHDVAVKAAERLKKYKPAVAFQETKDIEAEKNKFKTSTNVIVGTIGILGTGHTLTEAATVLFLDQPWTYAELNQAEDRAHRIGQKKSVRYITLICSDTVDERVNDIVSVKKDLSDMLIDNSKALTVDFLLKR